jgi:polyferredoxin
MSVEKSLSLANPSPRNLSTGHKIGLALVGLGLVLLLIALFGGAPASKGVMLAASLGSLAAGGLVYAWFMYMNKPAGIKNDGVWQFGESSRGAMGWIFGVVITIFYVALYWFPEWLGQGSEGNQGLVALFDPLSYLLKGQPASQWFVYGTFYTLAILVLGMKFIWKYRHNRYQLIRTLSVMFFQLGFAFLIPEILLSLNNTEQFSNVPYNDFKNMWPLNYYFFDSYSLNAMMGEGSGNLGLSMLVWGLALIFVVSPFLTYFFGKRWYCSWVCGCGGLAETAGDPFRHLSDKSLKAWKLERWLIHAVLFFAVIMTLGVVYSFYQENGGKDFWISQDLFVWGSVAMLLGLAAVVFFNRKRFKHIEKDVRYLMVGLMAATAVVVAINYLSGANHVLFVESYSLRKWYGFFIGAAFSGVIGVGFYPLLGSRVWCRFGCPMAAILGLQQRFLSRFRITTNGGQCISCGNCSTYCEMGIDVRAYAQKGQNIVRASCVGCGICAAVCPRGVLRLENGPNTDESRMEEVRY